MFLSGIAVTDEAVLLRSTRNFISVVLAMYMQFFSKCCQDVSFNGLNNILRYVVNYARLKLCFYLRNWRFILPAKSDVIECPRANSHANNLFTSKNARVRGLMFLSACTLEINK